MNALEVSKKMETDAIKFYVEAAQKMRHPAGKKMFLAITEDERRHLELISLLIRGLNITLQDVSPMKNVKTVFETMKGEMMQRVAASTDELEALRVAMEMEREGKKFYEKALAGATTDKEKSLFKRLIDEEQEHYAMFSNTYTHLSDTGNWYLWEERGVIEG
jgi:rubrerythrin